MSMSPRHRMATSTPSGRFAALAVALMAGTLCAASGRNRRFHCARVSSDVVTAHGLQVLAERRIAKIHPDPNQARALLLLRDG